MSDSFWEATYRQNIAKMIGVCWRYTHDRQTAEDLAHDAFLLAIDKVSSFENNGPFEAWLRRIVVNVALQHLREQKRQEKWEADHAYGAPGYISQDESPADNGRSFSESELLETIGYLPDHHRIVFNLYVIDNFTHAQIAALLGISEGTSKSHLARARKKIRALLDKQAGQAKKRKRAFFWLLFSHPIHPIDHLVAGKLKNLAIEPQTRLSLDVTNAEAPVPAFKPSGISYTTYWKTGVMGITTAVFLTGGANTPDRPRNDTFIPQTNPKTTSTKTKLSERPLFSEPKTATISENPVIVEKTKNSETMNTVNTLAGLMVASLALDTVVVPALLPNAFRSNPLTINRLPEPVEIPQNIVRVGKPGTPLVSGSFYASKLVWSGDDRKLYLLGDRVKVDVTRNKFTGSGKFSFLDEVHYLVVDGAPVKPNETVRLQEKRYKLLTLNASEGAQKYGDNGKAGVVEISLGE
ncbi:RNA polymerase sigma factor [Dyadobacter soli]|nr:RNA polymerase sigma factor [Dyadobacter soli]